MKNRLFLINLLIIIFTLSMLACSGTDNNNGEDITMEKLFPADNEVGTWIEDSANLNNDTDGPYYASDDTGVETAINGGAEPFFEYEYTRFGIEYYTDSTYSAELWIWKMQDEAEAKRIYSGIADTATGYGRYKQFTSNNSWLTDQSFGDQSRYAEDLIIWIYNAQKGKWFYEVHLDTEGGDTHAAGKNKGITLMNAVANKL